MMRDVQDKINKMPPGPDRDRYLLLYSRFCKRIDELPGRVADRIKIGDDVATIRQIYRIEIEHCFAELPPQKLWKDVR